MRKTAIIIVNWNTGTLLRKCLESLQRLPEQAIIEKVYVVDNASTDTSFLDAKAAVATWDKLEFIPLSENIGFAAANNTALKKLPATCDALLLNPDTEMTPGSLQSLLAALEGNPKAGIVGPQLLNPDGSLQHSVRTFPTFTVLTTFLLKIQSLAARLGLLDAYLLPNFSYSKGQNVDQVMGACFLIRREALQQVGLLDDKFFVWFEEVDYCKRTKDYGWEVVYTPNAEVVHYGGVSFNQVVGLRKALPLIKSVLHYARKHMPFYAYIVLVFMSPISFVLTIPASIRHAVLRRRNQHRL